MIPYNQFRDLVRDMRAAQREYFKTRSHFDRCYTAEWRDGHTCDLFSLDRYKK